MAHFCHCMTVNHIKEKARALSGAGGQSSVFDYDSYDWGCLRYLLELWIFLNRLRKSGKGDER
ncbi:MAG: hypothetical protein WAV32_02115 [Halobacteriota archaeon]